MSCKKDFSYRITHIVYDSYGKMPKNAIKNDQKTKSSWSSNIFNPYSYDILYLYILPIRINSNDNSKQILLEKL